MNACERVRWVSDVRGMKRGKKERGVECEHGFNLYAERAGQNGFDKLFCTLGKPPPMIDKKL